MVSASYLFVALSAIVGALAAPTSLDTADFVLLNKTSLVKRQDYTQNYKTGGTVNFATTTNGYSVTFSGAQDFVVGRGWNTGSARAITYSGTHTATAGTVTFQVYGWTTNPLVEYYIIEDYTSANQFGSSIGTVTSDGGTYNIYEDTRTNEPSITGTATFKQYISVRQSKRTSGTVTTANHFAAWKAKGLSLGTFNIQVLSTEGYNGAAGSTKQIIS
ncbi:Endo-1,4-beta-xylanase [Lachnellula suecica]|uniref:Endo-1,4-beta-xylanase n=1 Tax=Lachnellula suecica TaxID=602035 RepID=A0A8T9C6U4_9HELO|nr:Endo-1,4-beta-xylanase [Lachnellula suecica]